MHNLYSSNRKKKLRELIKIEKKLQKTYLTYYKFTGSARFCNKLINKSCE